MTSLQAGAELDKCQLLISMLKSYQDENTTKNKVVMRLGSLKFGKW